MREQAHAIVFHMNDVEDIDASLVGIGLTAYILRADGSVNLDLEQ